METTTYYDTVARHTHPEPEMVWIERVVAAPHHAEAQPDGRSRLYGYIVEADRWLRVILEDGKLFNAFFDRHALKRWGTP